MPFLDWVNKNQAKETTRQVPYHLLKQASVHGDVSGANADNLLIQGDNLLALKALVPFYAGQVKCIFIDPPYNTQSAFEHYDDKLEHSQWLSMMYPRLVLLRELLADDGSIWVSIDDREAHYLKVLMDEVFSRANFVSTDIWEKLEPLRAMGGQGDSREARPNLYYALQAPDGTDVFPKRQDGSDGAWRWGRDKVAAEASRIEWRQGRGGWTPYYRIYAEENAIRPPDFVAELTDGRLLAVEYKGEPYKTNDDSREKQQVGHRWEQSSGGRCLFLFGVKVDDQGRDVFEQLAHKLA